MQQAGLRRVKEDLSIIEQALGNKLPFGTEDIVSYLGMAVIGGILALFVGFWPMLASMTEGIAILVALIALIIWFDVVSKKYRHLRAKHPERLRLDRLTGIGAGVSVGVAGPFFLVGLFVWGMSWHTLACSVFFWLGLAALLIAIMDRRRIHLLGTTIASFFCAALIPYHAGLAIGGWMVIMGIVEAAIMHTQLRRIEQLDAAN